MVSAFGIRLSARSHPSQTQPLPPGLSPKAPRGAAPCEPVLHRIANRQLRVVCITVRLPDSLMPHLLSRKRVRDFVLAHESRPDAAKCMKVGATALLIPVGSPDPLRIHLGAVKRAEFHSGTPMPTATSAPGDTHSEPRQFQAPDTPAPLSYFSPFAENTKAKPKMPTRERFHRRRGFGGTGRPDKCLVVKSLASSLRPACPSQHGIHRHHHQGVEGIEGRALLGCKCCFPLSRKGKNQTVPSLALSRREGRQSP